MRNAAGQRLKRHAGLHVDERQCTWTHHRLRGLLQYIVFEKPDDLVPEAAFLQVRIDIDQQFIVVVGQRLARRLRKIIAGIGRGGDFGQFTERLLRTQCAIKHDGLLRFKPFGVNRRSVD